MKKILFSIIIFISLISFSQVSGVNFQDAEEVETIGLMAIEGAETFEKTDIAGKKAYVLSYPVNSTGLRHCIESAVNILYDNGLDYRQPLYASEIIPKEIDLDNINIANIYDLNHQLEFDMINETLVDNEENGIYREWKLKEGWQVQLLLTFAGYQIIITKK